MHYYGNPIVYFITDICIVKLKLRVKPQGILTSIFFNVLCQIKYFFLFINNDFIISFIR